MSIYTTLKIMTSLTFYGGINEIGGNKILLEDDGTRIFLDFGQSFGFEEEFFTGWLAARTSRFGLRDYFALGLMPKIRGLYSEKALETTDFKYTKPEFHGVFLSHIHYDHLAHIQFLDEELPVYLGETTKRMLDSWQTTSRLDFGEHEYKTFKTGDILKIDSLEIQPIHVDHSTPAAYGFIIHTSEGAIVYSGDFRLHGPLPEMTRDFIEKAADEKPVAMICEGTRVAPVEKRKNLSEKEVFEKSNKIISKTKKLVVTCFYGRDIDRMKTYHKLAKKTRRKFTVSSKTAHLLLSLKDDPGIEVPDPINDDNMLIYSRELKRRDSWEESLLESCVNSEYIHRHQSELILHLDFIHFTELIDIRPDPGSVFIHSMSEPFEEDDIEDEVKHNWLDYFGLKFHQAHASGHCSKDEIFDVLKEIDPKRIFPIHTEHQDMFKDVFSNVQLVEKGKKYEI